MRVSVEDVDDEDLLKHLPSACQFINNALNGGNVLVHSAQEFSRSAAVVAAYCMFLSLQLGVIFFNKTH